MTRLLARLRCLLYGHDDGLPRSTAGRIWLECRDCGRKTTGWAIAPSRVKRNPWPITSIGHSML